MTRRLLIFISLTWLALVAVAGPAQAASRSLPDLYRFSVPVADSSMETRNKAVRTAMAQVLVRVTGDRKVAKHPQAQPLILKANGYMQRFAYVRQPVSVSDTASTDDGTASPQSQLMLQGVFAARALDEAIRKAGLPLWLPQRPQLLVIVTTQAEGGPLVLDTQISTAFPELAETASARGLPIVLPEPNSLLASEAANSASPMLVSLADHREADYLLWGHIREHAGKWLLDAQLQQGGLLVQEWRLRSRESGALLREAVHRTGDWLAERHALAAYTPGGESIVGLWVSGVESGEDYMRVQQHLQNMPAIEQLSLVALVDGALVFRVSTEAGAEQLDRSIRQAGRLREEQVAPGEATLPIWTGEYEFHYRLP